MHILSNKKFKQKLQATYAEGQRSVQEILLTPYFNLSKEKTFRNNYLTYADQVNELYRMYYCLSDLGNDTTGTLIDLRTSVICGEGISVTAKNKKTLKWINQFIKDTGLNSDKLFKFVTHGELEGKQLIIIKPNKEKNKISLRQKLWYKDKYKVVFDEDNDEIKEIYIETDGIKKTIPIENAVFVKLSGMPNEYNETPSKAAGIIQQIKNHDKALYDMRKSNHHYGYPTPAIEAKDEQSAKATNDMINTTSWQIGSSFVSTGKMYYPQPPASNEVLSQEISINVKIISRRTGLPVHWLGWTDLMSNRATADDLAELIIAGTKTERLIWIDKIKEIIIKSMEIATDNGIEGAVYDENFIIDMPYISLMYLDKIANVWMPLQMNGVIAMSQLRNKLPGINPEETEELIDAEKEKNMERMKEFQTNINPDKKDDENNNEEETPESEEENIPQNKKGFKK